MSTASSFRLKLNRAYEHAETLDRETRAWIETDPYEIVDEADPEPPLHQVNHAHVIYRRFRITRLDQMPDRFLALTGDCLFNLRSSLDHLAFALALARTPSMTSEQEAGSEFPIFHDRPMRHGEERRKVGCINPQAAAIIKALQPHHRRDYRDDPLWQIHELNRIDKHRFLTVAVIHSEKEGWGMVGIQVSGNENMASNPYVKSIAENFRPLKSNAVLLRYAAIPKDLKANVQMHPFLSLTVLLGDGGPAPLQPLIPTLISLCDFVRDVPVAQLSKFL